MGQRESRRLELKTRGCIPLSPPPPGPPLSASLQGHIYLLGRRRAWSNCTSPREEMCLFPSRPNYVLCRQLQKRFPAVTLPAANDQPAANDFSP